MKQEHRPPARIEAHIMQLIINYWQQWGIDVDVSYDIVNLFNCATPCVRLVGLHKNGRRIF